MGYGSMPQAETPGFGSNGGVIIEEFRYPSEPEAPAASWGGCWEAEDDPDAIQNPPEDTAGEVSPGKSNAEVEQLIAAETDRAYASGVEHGREEARESLREERARERAAAEQERKRQTVELVRTFGETRDRYLQLVEHEVVKLALAIAARILRREAQMDPLLLMGAVRVAIGQLPTVAEVRLRVPAEDENLWSEAIRMLPNLSLKPTVQPDGDLHMGECLIETSMGTADLGIRNQLVEIERGFFDRVGARNSAIGSRQAASPVGEVAP